MALNLSRATKLYVSTVKDTVDTGHSTATTFEIPVLDGYSFSQAAETQTIELNEAGDAPVRGQKLFNIALNPAEISIPTYVRPYYDDSKVGTEYSCVEKVLWEAMVGDGTSPGSTTPAVGTNARETDTYFEANFKNSNKHDLLKLYLFFELDNSVYRVNDFAINNVEVDFSIDAIARLNWDGQGQTIDELGTTGDAILAEFQSWAAGTNYVAAADIKEVSAVNADADFIKNKLSSITLQKTTGLVSESWIVDYANLLNPTANPSFAALSYTCGVDIDGAGVQTVTIDGNALPWSGTVTVQDVINEINYQLDGAIAYIVETGSSEGDLRFVSSTAGASSGIVVTIGGVNDLLGIIDSVNFVGVGAEEDAGTGTPTIFNMPITGGSLTISNNVTYLTPEELGKVNVPIGGFTGTRSISGTVTAYLNTGAANTGGLLTDLLGDTDTVTQEFEMTMSMGGGGNTPKVDFIMNHAALVIPSFNVEDVLSTEIGFTALGETITQNDELTIRYYAKDTI